MNFDIAKVAKWARSQGWIVEDDASDYTRFYAPDGRFVVRYPATLSNPGRRMADLVVKVRAAGLKWPAPSKKEQRSDRRSR